MLSVANVLTTLTQLGKVDINQDNDHSTVVHEGDFHSFVANAFNKVSDTDMNFKSAINAINQSSSVDNPQKLIQLQTTLGEYSNYVSLVNTLARKGVATIETLEKAQ